MDVDIVVVDPDRPEQTSGIWVNTKVEVVNLSGKIGEVILTSIEVKSDEPKRPLVHLAIFSDVYALHKAHVGVIQ